MSVVFLHGLESGPQGHKYKALSEAFDEVLAPNCEDVLDVEGRMGLIEEATRGRSGLVVVGSSFGGLMAALLAHRYPERVKSYMLMAPALHDKWSEVVEEIDYVPEGSRIIHGRFDEVVPVESSRRFAERCGIPLEVVDDGHRLERHRDLMVTRVRELLESRME